ncbi:MAG: hypothetical protein JW715_05145 [Sedimentisphaerales bacterium]|nr:hypothetical protein [Sedimentisphaerales bacterium]
MAKKTRSGLQSNISHIFAGVPVPKKKQPDHTKDKPESSESETVKAEEMPVEKPPEKQPAPSEISREKPPVTESLAQESFISQSPIEQKKNEQPLVEPVVDKKPIIKEPSVGQPSAPYNEAIELPDIEEPIEAIQSSPAVGSPVLPKSNVAEQRMVTGPQKVSFASKQKRIKRVKSKAGVNPRKQTTMVVLAVSLSILLFFLLVKPFGKSPRRISDSRTGRTPTQQSSKIGRRDVAIDWTAPSEYPTEIRDPMLLSSQQQFYSKTWKPNLVGIVYNENQKYAIIGKEIVKEGEEINGLKIIKINKDSVEFERDGQKWTQEVREK